MSDITAMELIWPGIKQYLMWIIILTIQDVLRASEKALKLCRLEL